MIRLILAAFLLLPTLVRADYQEGVQLYATGKYTSAMEQFQKAAAENDPRAIYFVGFLHHNGYGVPKSDAEAMKWMRRSADMNHYDSQYYMGILSQSGKGVPHDLVAAHMWFSLAQKSAPNERDAAYTRREVRRLEKKMTPEQIGKSKQLVEQWKPAG
ncbi:MAG: sel1 repeat family protein [Burkholderiales bacterium]|nr:sel1 repeat family protein [Burkholderiales bacterium]